MPVNEQEYENFNFMGRMTLTAIIFDYPWVKK